MRGIPERADAEQALRKAQRLAWASIAYICSTIFLLFFVVSGSQALKTEMVGEIMALIPPTLFLIGDRIGRRPPDRLYPFGYERAVSAGYVAAAVALFMVGLFLVFDGGTKLVMREHPTIGGISLFGHVVWTGWPGIAVLLWSSVPAFFLGRSKRKLADILYDKTLAGDAAINAADWQSAAAAMVGIIGVGLGFWWADAAAAVLISVEILHSGWTEIRTALGDIMDRRPKTIGSKDDDPLPDRLTDLLRNQPWIEDVVVRVRERGRELTAEAHVVPTADNVSVDEVSRAGKLACDLDPRLAEVTIAPASELPGDVALARQAS